jgi:hypothetical protein
MEANRLHYDFENREQNLTEKTSDAEARSSGVARENTPQRQSLSLFDMPSSSNGCARTLGMKYWHKFIYVIHLCAVSW